MKHLVSILFLFTTFSLSAQIPNEIQNAEIISIDKLPARTAIWPAPSAPEALKTDYEHSAWVKSLNGIWNFHWSPDPMSRPVEFYKPGYDRKGWNTITVPSTIERQGFGSPLYVNSTYPFKVNPPYVMDEPDQRYTTFKQRNPVGSYCRTFTIPADWKDKEIILHLAGVSSAAFIWINGEKAGYTQDSRLPAEFAINKYLKDGENFLAIETYKYSDGSYLEDMDFWRFSGIFRDVFIRAVPRTSLWDIYAQPELNLTVRTGKINLHYTPSNFTGKKNGNFGLNVSVVSPSGKKIISQKKFKLDTFIPGFGQEIRLPSLNLDTVQLWYDETPLQYTAIIELTHKGKTVEAYRLPIAFRKIEVAGNAILLNGKKFKIRGVNRHEFSPDQGWTISKEDMIRDLELMKQGNVNFVRNSHYPNDPRWYELCDRYGIMVMDEANVESHGLSYHRRILPGDKPEWIKACVDRMERMVIRDRQYPCVTMWSLGNEAGYGNTFVEMRKATHKNDPELRLIQYADMNRVADIDSQTYPTADWLKQHLKGKAVRKGERGESTNEEQHGKYPSGKPFLLSEYAHAQGNSLGDLIDYWNLIYEHDMLIGGFIWDWVDQALWKDRNIPSAGYLYGGDFGDAPNDRNGCIDGLIGVDRIPHPHYYEMQKVYQPVAFKLKSEKPFTINVTNRLLATDLKKYDFKYQLQESGKITAEGILPDISIAPGSTQEIILPDYLKSNPEQECFLKISIQSREPEIWAQEGFTIAWEQFRLNDIQPCIKLNMPAANPVSLEESNDAYSITGDHFYAAIDRKTGMLSSYVVNDKELIKEPVRFNFRRTVTDNDKGWKVGEKMKIWQDATNRYTIQRLQIVSTDKEKTIIKGEYLFTDSKAVATIQHTIFANGNIEIDYNIDIPKNLKLPNIPRIGLQFEIEKDLQKIDWYGRGPHENYIDRETGAAIGTYHSHINDWITPYVRPQENANRGDIRWLRFSHGIHQLQFSASGNPFSASAWTYTQTMLEESNHDFELQSHRNIIVNIDCAQMGVGGDCSWGLPVLQKYQLKPETYHYRFVISAK